MKKVFLLSSLILTAIAIYSFTVFNQKETPSTSTAVETEAVKWYTFEQAVELNKTKPKKFVIDCYTSWCGWCKVMDKQTFTDKKIAAYMNEYFYPVKFDAEQKAELTFNGQKFPFVDQGNGRGYHSFAAALLDNQMSYPTLVYLTEKFERPMISPGFKEPKDLIKELQYVAGEHFRTTAWKDYTPKEQ